MTTNKKSKNWRNSSICVTMVPTVFVIFILYIGAYLGTMTSSVSGSFGDRINFTITDARVAVPVKPSPPKLPTIGSLIMANRSLFMANRTSMTFPSSSKKPKNQFMKNQNISSLTSEEDLKPSESQITSFSSIFVPAESEKNQQIEQTPQRPSTVIENQKSNLKRGPAITFLEPDPKIIRQTDALVNGQNPWQTNFSQKKKSKNSAKNPSSSSSSQLIMPPPVIDTKFANRIHDFTAMNQQNIQYSEALSQDIKMPESVLNHFSESDFRIADSDSGFGPPSDFPGAGNGWSQNDMESDYYEERKLYASGADPPDFDDGDLILTPMADFQFDEKMDDMGFHEKMDESMMGFHEKTDHGPINDDEIIFNPYNKISKIGLSGGENSRGDDGNFGQFLSNFPDANEKSSSSYGAPPVYAASGSGVHGSYSSSGHDDHKGVLAKTRKPGPYGYPSPNFKCEYAKETLYVTKTDWTFDKKCFTVYRTKCRQEYEEGKGIGFKKECSEFTVTRCRTEYDTDKETKCWTVFRKECFQVYVTKVDWEYEEKCETKYEEVCEGYGYDKHCHSVPKEHCHQIPVKVEKQVPRTKCKKVPEKKCQDFPIFIPRKACKDFPKTVCVKDPINTPRKIPKKVCASIPKEVCNKIPVQIIKHVPKTVTKKVCTSTKPSGYTPYSDAASHYPPATYHDAPIYRHDTSNYHTSRIDSNSDSNSKFGSNHDVAAADGLDADINNYFDGVAEVPHFDFE